MSFIINTFAALSRSVIMSVSISKFGFMQLIFGETWYKKIEGDYYRDTLLMELLPAIWSIADEVYIFRQDNAPAYRAHQTRSCFVVRLPNSQAPDMTLWPPNSPASVRLITAFGEWRKNESPTRHHRTWQILMSVVDEPSDQWQKRLDASVRVQGGYFEQKLRHCLSCVSRLHQTCWVSDISDMVV